MILYKAGTRAKTIDTPSLFGNPDLFMPTVLLIEDNEFIRDNTLQMLLFANYNVAVVSNGRQGLEMAMRKTFDLIICDIMMPELDGFGVLRELKSNPNTADIPFIFLTAKTSSGVIQQAFDMGADDYLLKPFHEQELLVAVEGCLLKKGKKLSEK